MKKRGFAVPGGLLLVVFLAASAAHAETWQIISDDAEQVSSIDRDSVRSDADGVWFRQKQVLLASPLDPGSRRPIREIQQKRIADCRKGLIATVSRAVFSEQDALIDYRATRPAQAEWARVAHPDQSAFEQVCGHPARRS